MRVLVVGAGPSGLHFALTALEKGQRVTLLDVGGTAPPAPLPEASLSAFKEEHPDPINYFLGGDYSGALIPHADATDGGEFYQLPPSKRHVFAPVDRFALAEDGFSALVSFAAGGLAECWTAGAYAFNDDDLRLFPFGYEAIAPHYERVAERIGVGGVADDLATFLPLHANLSEPVRLNAGAERLLASYEARRARLNRQRGVRMGRSRQATLSASRNNRSACTRCGRCLWGCPTGALYTPSQTLRDCLRDPNFTYISNRYASHFRTSGQSIDALVTYPGREGGGVEEYTADAFVLACGTLNTSGVFLRTLLEQRGEVVRLGGLMDNRQVLAPFFNLSMLGRSEGTHSYQYHQLAIGIPQPDPAHYVHGQVTTFSTGSVHSILNQMPLGLRDANNVFAAMRSGLGVINLNFHDRRRDDNYVTLDVETRNDSTAPPLRIRYRPPPDEGDAIRHAVKQVRSFFMDLGAPLIPGMTRMRPMGASVHYSGTLPMSATQLAFTVSPECQSYDFGNLFVVDGSVFPFLPAKNLTFTLMANATRVASAMFQRAAP